MRVPGNPAPPDPEGDRMTTTAPHVDQAYRRARYWDGMALAAERANRHQDARAHRCHAEAARNTAARWSVTA